MTDVRRNHRFGLLALAIVVAFAASGCYLEQRADGQWWACDTLQTSSGPVVVCQPLHVPGR